ncbi:energy transducer TonB [Oceanispirochaeta crateris]|uniref:Energy transducer TonB n=1 Tax=Oceanispirochaeta crateris TaxID=2518645 RepID=A0A5C1QMT0_9SPIO|nr:energy transducer TonB [Oceanispirochaeta crateris]QEN08529.1 energy transducer TonB [Oceanispirochaeta crateris]
MTPYQVKQQKKRTLLSVLFAILFHLLVLGSFILYDYFFIEELSDFSGPILVKLGEPEGEDLPLMPEDVPEEVPEEVVTPEDILPPVPETVVSEPSENTLPPVQPEKIVEKPTPTPIPIPAEPVVNTPATPPVIPQKPQAVIISGEDEGNSYEYQFEAEEGVIGRSLSTDISLYMPLPQIISSSLYGSESMTKESFQIGLTRQELIQKYYTNINGDWVYTETPNIDDIKSIWAYLKEAGYDASNADYKFGGNLNPVVISFTISGSAELIMSKVDKSSGDSRIDDSVLAGFRSATFSNSSNGEIKGRFTYRFQ